MPTDTYGLAMATYLLQAAGNVAIAGLLLWLHRTHPRRYLADWGWSWLALGGYHLLAAWSFHLSTRAAAAGGFRLAVSSASLAFAGAQLVWLAHGTRAMSSGRELPARRLRLIFAALTLMAVAATLATATTSTATRLFVRVGVRSLAAAAVLGAAAAVAWRASRRHRGVGPRLLAGAFLLYAADQLHYFAILAANFFGARLVSSIPLNGVIDLLLQIGVGIGMTVWLLEDEHRKLLRTSRELAHGQQRLNLVFEQMPVIVWSVDRHERVQSSLGSGLGAVGLRPGELVGVRLAEYLGESGEGRKALAAHRRALGGDSVAFDLTWQGRELHVRLEPLREADESIVGCVGVALDVTEEHRRQAAYSETQRLESLGVLASGIAHDLGNLLTGVLGHAELAQRRISPESPASPSLERAIDGALRAGDLARQLLAYAGRSAIARERVDLAALVRSMGDLLRITIPPSCDLRYELAGDLPAVIADSAQLRQVVLNLITNASESIDGTVGSLTIGTVARRVSNGELAGFRFGDELDAGEFVALRVADTGSGMNEATLAQIFEPFFTTKATGRGLGLAAVLGIVQRHRGALRVASAPGRGTEFEILLPAAPADAAPAN